MVSPAFLVEGQMEQKIVQYLCPGAPVRLIGCNGDDAPLHIIARFIDAQMRRLKNFHPVVIVLDRERRKESCDVVRENLHVLLVERGHKGQFIIGIADKMSENWILASWDTVCSSGGDFKHYKGPTEAIDGKAQLRRLLPDGEIYHETTTGVDLFLKCDVRTIYRTSLSFRKLADAVTFECRWLEAAFAPST